VRDLARLDRIVKARIDAALRRFVGQARKLRRVGREVLEYIYVVAPASGRNSVR